MICAISGVTPEDPVISKSSGYVFERRLIEKHLAETGTCPVTNESLTIEDLLTIKTNKIVKPRPVQATSIPGLLSLLQKEWDAVVLSNYELEQQLHRARQELSHALYQHDAACRVVARLKKERDEAMGMLADTERQIVPQIELSNGKRGPEEELVAPTPAKAQRIERFLSAEIQAELNRASETLSNNRKKRQLSPTLAKLSEVEQYTQQSSHPLHKTNKPGILCIDIHPEKDLILTGGNDNTGVLFDRSGGHIAATLSGHSKRVTCVKFVPKDNLVLTGSADKTVRLWEESENGYNCKHTFNDHSAEVRALTVHPTNKYFATASTDKTWAMFDIETGSCLTQTSEAGVGQGFTTAQFHPDGLILGTGGHDSVVRVWDVKTLDNVATFEGHTGPVTDISFSENGYFLATAGVDGVKLWDLRKLRNFRSFSVYDASTPTNSVQFDHSGSYLAFAGSDVRLYSTAGVKVDWNPIKTLPDLSGSGTVNCVRFGKDASYLALGSSDRNLRIFGAPATGSIEQAEA